MQIHPLAETTNVVNVCELLAKSRRVVALAKAVKQSLLDGYNRSREQKRTNTESLVTLQDYANEYELNTALIELSGAILLPPVGFEETAAALRKIVSVVKGIWEAMITYGVYSTEYTLFAESLHCAIGSLEKATHFNAWYHIFASIEPAEPPTTFEWGTAALATADTRDPNCYGEIERAEALAKREGFAALKWGGYNWYTVIDTLRERDPEAKEWEGLPAGHPDTVQTRRACVAYWERKDRERQEGERHAELVARLVAAMKRLRKNTTQKNKPKAASEERGLAGNALLIVTELAHHHRLRDATRINREPHSVTGIAKNIDKGKSVVSDFFTKHFREPDGTKGHAVYAKWCRHQWDAVVPTLLSLVESASRELSTGDVETKRKPDRLVRSHREQTAELDAELDRA